jgi:hypothetical protein
MAREREEGKGRHTGGKGPSRPRLRVASSAAVGGGRRAAAGGGGRAAEGSGKWGEGARRGWGRERAAAPMGKAEKLHGQQWGRLRGEDEVR